jgi:hypothetical protein
VPKKLDSCVKKVKAQGKDESAAYAICSKSTGIKRKKGGGWRQTKKKSENMKESLEKGKIIEFIKNVVDKDFSAANQSLQNVVDEKIKSRIRNYENTISEKDTENK